jgi:hypothetical protein
MTVWDEGNFLLKVGGIPQPEALVTHNFFINTIPAFICKIRVT